MSEDVCDSSPSDEVHDLLVELAEVVVLDVGVQDDQLHLAGRMRMNVVDGKDVRSVGLNFSRGLFDFRERARQLSAVLDDRVAAEGVDPAFHGDLLKHLDLRGLRSQRQGKSEKLKFCP